MKNLLLLFIAIVFSTSTFAQCNDLFISEYVHGYGNNRAIEIYNPTSGTVNLADYQLVRYSNGGSVPYILNLTNSIPTAEVWVIVSDKRDPAATGYDTMVDPALQAMADTFVCPVYSQNKMFYFNGNDAVTLEKGNGVYIDMIGKIGEDPGIAWTDDAANGYTSAGGGRWLTKRKTLVRKSSIQQGVTAIPPVFNAMLEWDTLPNMTFTNLQWHTGSCTPNGINTAVKKNDCFLYPNPTATGFFMVKGTEIIKSVELVNVVGKIIISQENPVKRGDMRIETNNIEGGVYFVNVKFADGTSTSKKVIIK